jgi:hypothetical protein
MKYAPRSTFTLVKLPATMGSRQSINVQLPTVTKGPAWMASVRRTAS